MGTFKQKIIQLIILVIKKHWIYQSCLKTKTFLYKEQYFLPPIIIKIEQHTTFVIQSYAKYDVVKKKLK